MSKKSYFFIPVIMSSLVADIIYVPDDYQTIQNAIDISSNGDSILVAPGVYYESINFEGKSIVVSSLYLIEDDSLLIGSTIIDAEESGSVATFSNNESEETILQGFTLQNGIGNDEDPDQNGSYYTYGGGIYCQGSDPVIKDCIIRNNTANEGGGGGIFCYNASPLLTGCSIIGNQTDDVGGGLYSRYQSSPEFYDCTFSGNNAEFGGGCYIRNESSPVMENVIFSNNTANNSGGGITLKDDADLVASGLYVINNSAEGLGGGLYVNNANPELTFCLISDNSSSSGAGIYIRNTSVVDLTNVTISNNLAQLYGNGIYLRDDVEVSVLNSVVWGNGTPQIYFRSEGAEVELSTAYSIVEDGENGVEVNENGEFNWGAGSISDEPYFCNSGEGNYYVRENSPCINGGAGGSLMGCFDSACGPVNLGPVWYVDHNGNNESDGSQETPFKTIDRAMASAVSGDTIRLNPGIYYEPFDFNYKELVLESRAFELDDYQLISDTYFSAGPLGGSCLSLNGPSNNNGTVRGISFKGGFDSNGGGLVVIDCSPKLIDLIMEDNSADFGGGLYLSESNAIIENIVVSNNAANYGGGIFIADGSPLISGLVVNDNIAYWGGGLYFENAEPYLNRCKIMRNEAFIEGAGIYQNGGSSFIDWTAIEHNNGYDYGGGLVAYQASMVLDQVTFAGNVSGVGSTMAMYSSLVKIENSILWGNNGPAIYAPDYGGITNVEINFTNIEGGANLFVDNSNINFSSNGGIINQDPEFCSPDSFSYGLMKTSVCLNASDSSGVIGAYDMPCDQMSLDRSQIAQGFTILRNYPNPFNPRTNIQYNLFFHGPYSLKIFDSMGNQIRTLKSEVGTPGLFTAEWNGTNDNGEKVSSGVYFYQLMTSKNVVSNKMILLK